MKKLFLILAIFSSLVSITYSDSFIDMEKRSNDAAKRQNFLEMENFPEIILVKEEDKLAGKADKGIPDIYLVSKKQDIYFKRSAITMTGLEYEKNEYDLSEKEELISYILADGMAKINEDWSLIYVVRDINTYKDDLKQENNFSVELKPRYSKAVNQYFSYGLEIGYEHQFGDTDKRLFSIMPDITFNYDKHFLYMNFTDGIKTLTGERFYETEPLYLYKITDKLNIGMKGFWREERDTFGYKERAIRPLVQYRFDNNMYVELRLELGKTEFGENEGYEYTNYCLYSIIPTWRDFNILFEFSYRDQNVHSEPGWGDKEGIFSKLGVIWTI